MRSIRRLSVGTLIAALTLATAITPVQAATPDPVATPATGTPKPSYRIIGGTPSTPGAWPSQVALLHSGESDNFEAQFCSGTVIDPSWILTAAHCLVGENPGDVDVLTDTQSLASGGTRHRAAELRVFPTYNASRHDGDYGLVRLADPTTAPVQPFIGQGGDVALGTRVVTTGWGNTGGFVYPTELRQANLTTMSNAACDNAGYFGEITGQMLCAGVSPYLTVDSCDGDSGGPLLVSMGGRWVQIGITSWGDGCAEGAPGVYARVAAQSNWISAQIRFGPHSNATDFVRATWGDLYASAPSNTDLFLGVASQNSVAPTTWLSQQIQGRVYQARMGGVTRLYRAFFLRDPDTSGTTFWWNKVNSDWTLWRVAEFFSQSSEFNTRYGALGDGAYVDLVYQNVLGRAPEASGRAYWVDQLARGLKNRGQVMVGFSESSEYVRLNKARTDVQVTYFGLLHRLPSDAELATWMLQPNSSLIGALFASLEYHRRF